MYLRTFLKAALVGTVVAAVASPAIAGDEIRLRDGVLVDPVAGQVIFMQPAGGIASVAVGDGATTWQSSAADRPLELRAGQVLCQIDTARPGVMDLARINLANGQIDQVEALALPPQVVPHIDEQLGQTFEMRLMDGGVTAWQYQRKVVSGMANPDADTQSHVGAFAVTESAVEMAPAPSPGQLASAWQAPQVVAANLITDASGRQFRSNDGQHILVSRPGDDVTRWDRHIWDIYTTSGQKLGTTRSHMSYTPFVVVGGQLLFVTQPYSLASESGVVEHTPLMLRAVNLASGSETWHREIRDTRYQGPFPV